jgi:GT2 family glycosyltransferase
MSYEPKPPLGMEMNKRVICVILHYGSATDTWNCVRTMLDQGDVDILVADNDPSQNLLIPLDLVKYVELYRTGGVASFSASNNMAVRFARKSSHEFLFILNNDTLVESGALRELMGVLDDKDIGAVGPCIQFANEPAKIWACGGAIDKLRIRIGGLLTQRGDAPYDVDYLPGAAILCKLAVWDLVGGLPENYFLTYEEAEFALRTRACGYRVVVVPRVRILHQVGMSSDSQPMYVYNAVRSRVRFGQYLYGKYFGFLLGALNTIDERRRSRYGLRLWASGLGDELLGNPLDRAALQKIQLLYG